MPIFRSRAVLEVARGIRAFLILEAGLTGGTVPDPLRGSKQNSKTKNQNKQQVERQSKGLSNLVQNPERTPRTPTGRRWAPTEPSTKQAESSIDAHPSGTRPENLVWIFGFGRSGSTWLRSMMTELDDHQLWEEPLVGLLFGNFYDTWGTGDPRGNRDDFVFGGQKEVWLNSIRSFVLERIKAQFPNLGDDILVIKEPNGSIGAPLLMQALPESRMILLVRDPRDVMASFIDSQSEKGWGHEWVKKKTQFGQFDAKGWSSTYIKHFNNAKQAYEAHEGPKVVVKYEQLLADPLSTMKNIYSALRIEFSEEVLTEAVETHSWENIPKDQKGQGKFYRKATPGAWKEDLSPEQLETVEKVVTPVLKEFYSRV